MQANVFSGEPATNGSSPHPVHPPSAESLPRLTRLADLVEEIRSDAEAAYDARQSGVARGPVTGHRALDQELGGVLQPGLHNVSGGPGVGKTALALQIAAECGTPALYLSCEMGLLELLRRHTARVTGTYLGRLKTGELHPNEVVRLVQEAAAKAPQLALADATQAYANPGWIRDAAEAIRGDSPHLLLVVDSVHSWAEAAPMERASEYDALNAAIASLRDLAAQLRCPVLGIVERNRASMEKGGLHAAAGSRRFEYGAESVLDLMADKDAGAGPTGELAITLKIEKNRNGSPGRRIPLRFHGALQTFREVDG